MDIDLDAKRLLLPAGAEHDAGTVYLILDKGHLQARLEFDDFRLLVVLCAYAQRKDQAKQ